MDWPSFGFGFLACLALIVSYNIGRFSGVDSALGD